MPPTLLLADDSVTIQRVFELTFADEDIRVIAVGDGQQAIDQIKADPPDIVLADTGMPERDGYDVATFIKADPALAHIPVVLLTGAFEPVNEDRARQVGCDAVLVKPFEPQVVIDRVRELLGRGSAVAVPATTSGPVEVVPPQDADADAPALHRDTPGRSTRDPDARVDLPSRPSAGEPEPAPSLAPNDWAITSDDPLGDDLERMDDVFDRFEAGEAMAAGQGPTAPEEPRPAPQDTSVFEGTFGTPEGGLKGLEGAFDTLGVESVDAEGDGTPVEHEGPPSIPDAASPPPDRSVEGPVSAPWSPPADGTPAIPSPQVFPPLEPVAPAPQQASGVEQEATSLTETSRPVEAPGSPPPSPSVSAPPSLADAFASLLAAEQSGAELAETIYPWPRRTSSPGIDEELIDRVAERVIARLSDGVTSELVDEVVTRVTERLVRREIDRKK